MYIQYTPRAILGNSPDFLFNQRSNWKEPLLHKGLFQQLFFHMISMNETTLIFKVKLALLDIQIAIPFTNPYTSEFDYLYHFHSVLSLSGGFFNS